MGDVGVVAPLARSSVIATVEPFGAGRVSVTICLPPPVKSPAGCGAFFPSITQISQAFPDGAAPRWVTVSCATPLSTATAALGEAVPPETAYTAIAIPAATAATAAPTA